jgi:carbon monoxide dehydrogenase subunit G
MGIQTYFAIGGAALAVIAAVPFLLPAKARVERSAVVAATPEAVFPLVNSSEGFNRFNPFRDRDPNLKITYSGPKAGRGASFAWAGKEGSGVQTISSTEDVRQVVMQLDLGTMGRPVQTFALEPVAGGIKVTWSLDADFGVNPVARVFGKFMDGKLGLVYEKGLQNLSRTVEKM